MVENPWYRCQKFHFLIIRRYRNQFLECHKLPKLNQYEIENLKISPITIKELELIITKLPKMKSSGSDGFTGKFFKALKEDLFLPSVLMSFQIVSVKYFTSSSSYPELIWTNDSMVNTRIFKLYYTEFLLIRGAPQEAITCGGKRMSKERSPDTITLFSLQ